MKIHQHKIIHGLNISLIFKIVATIIILGLHTSTSIGQVLPLVKGEELKIRLNSKATKAMTFEKLTHDSIFALNETIYKIPLSLIQSMQVQRGKKNNFLKGAALGAFLGGVAGYISAPSNNGFFDEIEIGKHIVTGLSIGIISGSLFGILIKSDKWQDVPIQELRLTPSISSGAIGLGISTRIHSK